MYGNEPSHWKEAVATGLSLVLGVGLVISSTQNVGDVYEDTMLIVGGLVLIVLSIASFAMTDGWKHVNDLPTSKKILVYIPVVVTGVALIALVIAYAIGREVFKSEMNKNKR